MPHIGDTVEVFYAEQASPTVFEEDVEPEDGEIVDPRVPSPCSPRTDMSTRPTSEEDLAHANGMPPDFETAVMAAVEAKVRERDSRAQRWARMREHAAQPVWLRDGTVPHSESTRELDLLDAEIEAEPSEHISETDSQHESDSEMSTCDSIHDYAGRLQSQLESLLWNALQPAIEQVIDEFVEEVRFFRNFARGYRGLTNSLS